jgi:hypothetical protein
VITKRAARWSMLAQLTAGVLALAGATITPSYAASGAEVFIVQGLPGKDLDVAIDGESVAEDVRTAAVAGPFKVDPGTRMVTFSENGTKVVENAFSLKEGFKAAVVAHLPASPGDPMVTVNQYRPVRVPNGKAVVTVSHNAEMAPADIRVNGVLFGHIANGKYSEPIVVPGGGKYQLTMVPTGTSPASLVRTLDIPVTVGSNNHFITVGRDGPELQAATVSFSAGTTGSGPPSNFPMGTGGQAGGDGPSLAVDLVR